MPEQNQRSARLSHAYILSGPDGPQKRAQAQHLAQTYVCTGQERPCGVCPGCRKAISGVHPDLIHVGEEGKDINVATVRALRSDAYVLPNEAERKVYLIDRADTMNPSAQNAMLKLLEDGPPYAAFLLLADQEGALLPTVRSRCELIRLDHLEGEDPDPELVTEADRLSTLLLEGRELELLEYCVTLEKWDRDRLSTLFDLTIQALQGRLVGGQAPKRTLSLIGHVKDLKGSLDFNVGAGHIAGRLCAGACSGPQPQTPRR